MIGGAKVLAVSAALMFVGGSLAASAATGATGAGAGAGQAGGAASLCEVRVDRSGAAGSFVVSQAVLRNGKCVCFVKTGARSQGGDPETMLAQLLKSRTCSDAPPAVKQSGSNFIGAAGLPIFAASGAGGAAVAATSASGKDSP